MARIYKQTAVQICGECRGEGCVYREVEPARHGSDTGVGNMELCPLCRGSGMVKVTRDITITIEAHHPKLI